MDVKEVREHKEKLESVILNLVREFEFETGVQLTKLSIYRMAVYEMGNRDTTGIITDVKFEVLI